MTEPIRLWYLSSKVDDAVFVVDSSLVYGSEDEAHSAAHRDDRVVELAEVRRCGTCAYHDAKDNWCSAWQGNTEPEDFCNKHKEKSQWLNQLGPPNE